MTAQTPEVLIYKNLHLNIDCEPLQQYFQTFINLPVFTFNDTDCYRGYKGKWEIKENKLYIIDLNGHTSKGYVNLNYLFPQKKEVFADWFSGVINIPQGEVLEYSRLTPISYEKYIVLTFENGVLVKEQLRDNKANFLNPLNFTSYLDEFVKKEINNSSLLELIEMFNNEFKIFAGENYADFRKINFEKETIGNVKIDISNWSATEKDQLLTATLKGLNIYYFVITNEKSFPVSNFNSIMNAINGEQFVFVNTKSIKWFPNDIKNKLKIQKLNFPDFPSKNPKNSLGITNYNASNWLSEASGTDDPEIMNDVYWNID